MPFPRTPAALAAAVACCAAATFLTLTGLDARGPPDDSAVPAAERAAGDDLDARLAACQRRTAARFAAAHELADGRLDLAGAVVRVRAADGGTQLEPAILRVYPGRTTGERYARNVIVFTVTTLWNDPRRQAVSARLAADLAWLIADGGPADPPD